MTIEAKVENNPHRNPFRGSNSGHAMTQTTILTLPIEIRMSIWEYVLVRRCVHVL